MPGFAETMSHRTERRKPHLITTSPLLDFRRPPVCSICVAAMGSGLFRSPGADTGSLVSISIRCSLRRPDDVHASLARRAE
jgi:hypothetical protein